MRMPTVANSLPRPESAVIFGEDRISIDDIVALADGRRSAALSEQTDFRDKIAKGSAFLDKLLQEDGVIYGVTTGYGDSCTVIVPATLVDELPAQLTRFHGCGMGAYFDRRTGRAILAARLASLAQGYSGVRMALLDQIGQLLNLDIVPVIPEEGSVGASGDLTPLSYVAAALMGERQVYYSGKTRNAGEVLREAGLQPLPLKPKEGLAVMNGTAVMTGIACLAYSRAEYLTRLAARITALASLALKGNGNHFDDLLFAVKPHPGQGAVAAWIREDINHREHPRNSDRLQDRYSIRCAPHVIGVLNDSLPWMRQMIENELNSANDNPIIDGRGEHVLHGGHFYGGHIAFVMDSMKNCVANLADLMDRQLALLVDTKFNNGLPANLSGATGLRKTINHGMKAVQIAVSAWTAEALKNSMPASVFSRSTECHNQDKVSMGTMAARDCLRSLQLTEQVAAASLLAASQALELRLRAGEISEQTLSAGILAMRKNVSEHFEFMTEDRALESTLRQFVELIQRKQWALYPEPGAAAP
jgi:histidine ammonia-lyase